MHTVPAVVRYLASLPRELVHQVLNDLSVYKVLLLAIHGVPYINECILSHLQLRELFPSPAHLSDACSYFQLYTDIFHSRAPQWRTSIVWKPRLERSFYSPVRRSYRHKALIEHLRSYITKAIQDTNARIPFLSSFLPTPFPEFCDDPDNPSTYLDLQLHWTSLCRAQHAINTIKSSQLRRLADLVEEHPFVLKMIMDPSQERRRNIAHIVGHIRETADRITRVQVVDHKVVGRHLFNVFPLVPYDRYLRLFLKIIKRYPPHELCVAGLSEHRRTSAVANDRASDGKVAKGKQSGKVADAQPDSVSKSPKTSQSLPALDVEACHTTGTSGNDIKPAPDDVCKKTHYPYPLVVAQSVVDVVHGMAYVYTSVHPQSLIPSPKFLRTMYTPYSEEPYRSAGGLNQPMFVSPNTNEIPSHLEPTPLCEKELEWLTAFLGVCKFMSRMGDAKWNSQTTVAEMWKRMVD